MDSFPKINDLNQFRLDKNIAFNVLEFNKIENVQTKNIVKSLLIYFSFQFQKDLFGYGTIDLNDFAKKMNFDRTNLSRRISEPKYLIDGFNGGDYSTYLENALYILATTSIFEEFKGSTETHDFKGIKNFIIIKELSIHTAKTTAKGTPKKFYKYKLDETFEQNLKKFFLITDINTYLNARSFNGEDFYLQIKNIYHTNNYKGVNRFEWTFDYILQYFKINEAEVKKQKYRLNLIFKKYEVLLKEEIKGIKFYWEKENDKHKYAYKACVKWDKVDIELIKNNNYKELDQLFYDTLKRNLYDIFNTQTDLSLKSLNIDEKQKHFDQWMSNIENRDIIISTYVTVYSSLHKKKSYPSPETLAQSFINRIKKFTGNDMHLIFNNAV